jgi:polyhydroxybutyrate depolymerase
MSHLTDRARVLVVAVLAVAMTGGAAPAVSASPDRYGAPGRCQRPDVSGDTTVDVRYAGVTYPVLAYVPDGAPDRRLPLVLNLHGSSSNGPVQMAISGLRAVADAERFVVAAPNGAIPLAPQSPPDPAGSWAWNVPGVPTTAGTFPPPDARDDVGYLARVADVLAARLCTDPRRTYAAGYSGGGRMASALACRIAERIAAIAPVAGLRAGRPDPDDVTVPEVEDCRPTRPVPVVTFHGQEDLVNPYPGNGDLRWGYAVPLAVQTWARLDECRRGPDARRISEHVTLLRYGRCDARAVVALYRVSNGGHTWPGSTVPVPGLGTVTQEINASRIMWDFFEDYRVPR